MLLRLILPFQRGAGLSDVWVRVKSWERKEAYGVEH